jgi:hypothetical protein
VTDIADIMPLIESDGKAVELGWQVQRSEKVIAACRPVLVSDWLSAGIGIGMILGFFAGVILALIATLYGPTKEFLVLAGVLTFALTTAAAALLNRRAYYRDRQDALNALAPGELSWHKRVIEIATLTQQFDTRLKALKDYAANTDDGCGIDMVTVMQCAEERNELDGRRRSLAREEAIRRLKESGYYGMVEIFSERESLESGVPGAIREPIQQDSRVTTDDDGTDFSVARFQNRWKG